MIGKWEKVISLLHVMETALYDIEVSMADCRGYLNKALENSKNIKENLSGKREYSKDRQNNDDAPASDTG